MAQMFGAKEEWVMHVTRFTIEMENVINNVGRYVVYLKKPAERVLKENIEFYIRQRFDVVGIRFVEDYDRSQV